MLVSAILLVLAPLAAEIVLNSPNGGEPMTLGQHWMIAWAAPNVTQDVKIVLLKSDNSKFELIKANLKPGSSPYSWTIGQTVAGMAPPGSYKIRVATMDNVQQDVSAGVFSIAAGEPSLKLTSPNGGENWPNGLAKNITWKAKNWSGQVKLELWQNGERKGIIATGVASSPGSYSWKVGQLALTTAGIGAGFKVRVIREYMVGPHSPIPVTPLMDESDSAFSIGLQKPDSEAAKLMGIKVIAPVEGNEFEYGSFAINGQRSIKVPVRWTADNAGPFRFFLHEVGSKPETPIQPLKAPAAEGNQTYGAELVLSTKNTVPGRFYKIHVTSAGNGGYSGKFQLKYKLHEVTLEPAFYDKYYYSYKYYSDQEFTASKGLLKEFPSKPKNARVGFHNSYNTWPNGEWSYTGFLFRSRIVFDLSRFAKLKGSFKEAKLIVQQNEFHHNPGIDPADCLVSVYVLAEPWSGGGGDAFFAIPGNLIQQFPNGTPNNFDIPDWCKAWADGASPNYGLLFVGGMEKMNHDKLFHISYYQVFLKIQFQEE